MPEGQAIPPVFLPAIVSCIALGWLSPGGLFAVVVIDRRLTSHWSPPAPTAARRDR